jgi:hypothetical protein
MEDHCRRAEALLRGESSVSDPSKPIDRSSNAALMMVLMRRQRLLPRIQPPTPACIS